MVLSQLLMYHNKLLFRLSERHLVWPIVFLELFVIVSTPTKRSISFQFYTHILQSLALIFYVNDSTAEQIKNVFRLLFEEKLKNAELKLITVRYPKYFEEDDCIRVMIVFKLLEGNLNRKENLYFTTNAIPKL